MTVTAVVACWCVGSCLLAPLVGKAIRCSRAGMVRMQVSRRPLAQKIAEVA